MDPTLIPMVLKPLAKAAEIFKLGATGLSASFGMFTNPIRDYQTYLFQRREGKGVANAAKPLEMFARYALSAASDLAGGETDILVKARRQLGGELGTDVELNRSSLSKGAERFAGKDTVGRRLTDLAMHPVETLKNVIGASDS